MLLKRVLALPANEGHVLVKMAKRMTGTVAAMFALCACAIAQPGMAQDMMRYVALNSPDMTTAEMPRDAVAAMVKAATPGHPTDFPGKKLSGLDLSGLDLSFAVFRAGRLNKTKLVDTNLDDAVLDQAWLLEPDLTGASLHRASIFAAQMRRARLDGANLSSARVVADLTDASLVGAKLSGANLAADMKNQSMGL